MRPSLVCALLGSLVAARVASSPLHRQAALGAPNFLKLYLDENCQAEVKEIGLFNDKQCVNVGPPPRRA